MLTYGRLISLLHYDPDTGQFTWKLDTGRSKSGSRAGNARVDGYWQITIDRGRYLGHRIAWLFMTGAWPLGELDHINCVRSDNRWANLRSATRSQNNANGRVRAGNKSGLKGVTIARSGRYRAAFRGKGQRIHLGTFDTPEAAHAAYMAAAREHFGEFARAA